MPQKDDMTQFALRVPKELMKKLGYIAKYNGRSKNKELEQLIRARIKSFEHKFGEIKIENEE